MYGNAVNRTCEFDWIQSNGSRLQVCYYHMLRVQAFLPKADRRSADWLRDTALLMATACYKRMKERLRKKESNDAG